jgi:hypothetical protein
MMVVAVPFPGCCLRLPLQYGEADNAAQMAYLRRSRTAHSEGLVLIYLTVTG